MGSTSLAENHLLESLIRFSTESYAPHRGTIGELMSALGQKQTLGKVRLMSALLPKADIDPAGMSALCQFRRWQRRGVGHPLYNVQLTSK
jgi:hypothetical protein